MSQIDVADIDIAALRTQFLGHEFDAKAFEIEAEEIIVFARACGEQAPRYLDAEHPDFQAPPTFTSSLMTNRQMPEAFPSIDGLTLNAGKSLELLKPVRPGRVTGRSQLHDLYEKTGRSGRMVFIVSRMALYDDDDTLLALSDSRQVIREKPRRAEP
jgi:hypothetical protein